MGIINFVEKTFAGGAKFVNVFSLESIPLQMRQIIKSMMSLLSFCPNQSRYKKINNLAVNLLKIVNFVHTMIVDRYYSHFNACINSY